MKRKSFYRRNKSTMQTIMLNILNIECQKVQCFEFKSFVNNLIFTEYLRYKGSQLDILNMVMITSSSYKGTNMNNLLHSFL